MDKFSAVENSYSNRKGKKGYLTTTKKQGQDLFTWNARRNTEIDTKKRRLLCIDSRLFAENSYATSIVASSFVYL